MTTVTSDRTQNPKTTRMSGARALVEALAAEGVEVIFGYPGAATIPIHDILMEGKIRHILTRHEQGAAHAADGYARATGRPGVCLATSGPGALNLVTGIATAYMDSVPMVAITGQVATTKLGTDAFQEADITGVTMPVAKHSMLVKSADNIASAIREAFYIASTGRPGPVVVDIPIDISFAEVDYIRPEDVAIRSYSYKEKSDPKGVSKAVELLKDAKRPIICAGGGVIAANASDELARLINLTGIPVVYTLMGKGAFSDDNPLNMGMIGMHGCPYANYAALECDLFISVGMRFSDRSTGKSSAFAPHAKIVHIDIDPAEIAKIRKPDVWVISDARLALEEIANSVECQDLSDWHTTLHRCREENPLSTNRCDGRIQPYQIFDALNKVTGLTSIVTTDVGQHQMWSAQMCKTRLPRTFLSSGGLGTMGYGLPAAIGAQVAFPEKHVFAIAGDGSILMNSQEFMTAVENKLPVKILLFNNGYLGMVRQWQQIFYDRRYASTDISAQPDFVALAKAYGAAGLRVEKAEDLDTAIAKSLEITDRPCLLDIQVSREACVLPMIPAGGSVEDMILELD